MAKIKKKRIAYVSIMTVHSRQIEMCTHAHGAMWELAPESIEQTHTHTQVVRVMMSQMGVCEGISMDGAHWRRAIHPHIYNQYEMMHMYTWHTRV